MIDELENIFTMLEETKILHVNATMLLLYVTCIRKLAKPG